jgi:hypothetical protein
MRNPERRTRALIPLLLVGALALAACSSISTTVDYDRSVDFTRYRTYSWREGNRVPNPRADRRIKAAVDRALESRGLTRVEDGGDLRAVYHGRTRREIVVDSYNPAWGYGWRWGWGRGGFTTVRAIPIGTLIVDLVDRRENELVWRSTASSVIDRYAEPEERARDLDRAVEKMFKSFPPGRRR